MVLLRNGCENVGGYSRAGGDRCCVAVFPVGRCRTRNLFSYQCSGMGRFKLFDLVGYS